MPIDPEVKKELDHIKAELGDIIVVADALKELRRVNIRVHKSLRREIKDLDERHRKLWKQHQDDIGWTVNTVIQSMEIRHVGKMAGLDERIEKLERFQSDLKRRARTH